METQTQTQDKNISIEEIIVGKIDEIYNRYVTLTSKHNKLETVKKVVDELKQKLGKNIYTISIRWLAKIGEVEAIVDLTSDSEIVKRITEIWNYLFPTYDIDYVKIIITTYNITDDKLDKHEDEEVVKILGTPIYIKRTDTTCYKNYIQLISTTINNIPIYIYLQVDDCES